MKIPHYVFAFTTLAAFTTSGLAGTTAKQALATLKTAEGTSVTSNIISLTGRFGQDQPQEWEILARHGDQFTMFIVDSKSVISMSKVRTKSIVKLPTNALKLDSSKAFVIADKSAKKASVGFDSLNYSLKPRSDKATPVWIVSLADSKGTTVGEIHIAADSGSVLRSSWDKEQLNRPVQAAPSSGGTRGILADRRNTSTKTGTTADGVRDGLATVGDSIRNVFRRGQVSKTDQRRSPKTSKTRPK